MKAFVFPGQGSQFVGMGKDLYDNNALAKELFDKADELYSFPVKAFVVRRFLVSLIVVIVACFVRFDDKHRRVETEL